MAQPKSGGYLLTLQKINDPTQIVKQLFGTKMYQRGEVADAIGTKSDVVGLWLSRGYVPLVKGDKNSSGKGNSRILSFNTAICMAVGAALARQGMQVREAMQKAKVFAYAGCNGRREARPFADGVTYLVVSDGFARVFQHADGEDFMTSLTDAIGSRPSRFTIIDCTEVYLKAVSVLGGDPSGDYRDQSRKPSSGWTEG